MAIGLCFKAFDSNIKSWKKRETYLYKSRDIMLKYEALKSFAYTYLAMYDFY